MPCWCIRKRVSSLFTCLEDKPLESLVVVITVFDQVWSTLLLLVSIIFHFLFVDPTGKAGFVHDEYHILWNPTEIYRFRRFQEWEIDEKGRPLEFIDFTGHEEVNRLREKMDQMCSDYENGVPIIGDPGDYLKAVAGHPNASGWNECLKTSTVLWLTAIFIMYFTTPSVLLAVWWRRRRGEIICVYIFVQTIALLFLVAVCFQLRFKRVNGADSQTASMFLMCALDIIYGEFPVRKSIYIFTGVLACYQLVKYLFFEMYVIEMHLLRKRKVYGFRKTLLKSEKKKSIQEQDQEQEAMKARKVFDRVGETVADGREGTHSTKVLARELLELGENKGEEHSELEEWIDPQKRMSKEEKKKMQFAKLATDAMRHYSKAVKEEVKDTSSSSYENVRKSQAKDGTPNK